MGQRLKEVLVRVFSIPNLERFAFYSFFVLAICGGIFLGYLVFSVESKQDLQRLETFRPTLPTRLYDIEGNLISELYQHKWELAYLEEVPRPVVAAFLAVEDTNFYSHFGVDFMGILRAAWANIKAGRVVQGGSTITQQLVKGLSGRKERTIFRKLYEAVLALQVEKEFSKDEILEMYFNQVYLGHGTVGLATASRFYFSKPVQRLNAIEGAILAALPKAPHSYSPFRSPHASRRRNRIVMRRMAELGYLSREEADNLYDTYWPAYWKRIILTPPSMTSFGEKVDRAPYFTEYVRQQLIGLFGKDNVYSRGYQVYTTLDLYQQKVAEDLMLARLKYQDPIARRANSSYRSGIDGELLSTYRRLSRIIPLPKVVKKYSLRRDYRKRFKKGASDALELLSLVLPLSPANKVSEGFLSATREFKSDLKTQGAFLAMEPHTGRITAMMGGREFKASSQYNRAVQARRQPGSSFKPFVYGAAIEDRAVHFGQGFVDSPVLNIQPDGTMWAPVNYGGKYKGYVLMNRALAKSLNLVSVQIYDKVGPDKIIDFASRLMKIPPARFQPNPSLSLGSSEVTPMELLLGYSILTNGGVDIIPHPVIYITDRDGNVIYNLENQIYDVLNYKKKNNQIQIIEPSVAYITRKLMEGVINSGTARTVRNSGNDHGPAAGKTGSTSSWNDSWFAGATPDLAAVSWIGLDNGSMSLGRHQAGGAVNAPIWGEFMAKVYKKRGGNPKPFPNKKPRGVRMGGVCKFTGKFPNKECDTEISPTMFASPVKIGRLTKRVAIERCDCVHVESSNFFELMQQQNKITDEELGKTKKFHKVMSNE